MKPLKKRGKKMTEASPYDRLGGAFAIAAVVDNFSDAIVHNPMSNLERLPARLSA